ncbi:hypothetical protein [Methylobacterium nonmethylotrophicum]|uniref:Uncharacterized protein n=1 Tax=Methylobacterium nonmethylotrophicum TaxID=1141884 RepID=A0A4Z0NMX5_9HYPH|nr:hypothetical protein [Methylobacterium nonmethylotrophicum]TGD97996.1 hypothetical protein EU555_17725 [Methylobacterium nonmethylotrophicum]
MTRHRARPSFTVEIKRSRTSPLTAPADSERPQSERLTTAPSGNAPSAKAALVKPSAAKLLANKPAPAGRPAAMDEPERRPSGRDLWAGTGLLEEAAAATQSGRFDPPEASVFAKPAAADPAAAKAQAAPAKRVLPSLIAPPEPEPEPAPAPEPEPKLPRVRRYRAAEPAPRRAGPRPAFVWPEDWPDEDPIQAPAPIALPAAHKIKAPTIQVPKIQAPRVEAAQAPDAGEIRARAKRRTADEDLRVGQRWKRRLPRVCW